LSERENKQFIANVAKSISTMKSYIRPTVKWKKQTIIIHNSKAILSWRTSNVFEQAELTFIF